MSEEVKSYQDLLVWQKGMDLAEELYAIVAEFPQHELYGLTSQLCRAGVSVPSNIAEGSSRRSKGEFVRFINIASGSLSEIETQSLLARRFDYISESQVKSVFSKTTEISKRLFSLQRSLTEKAVA